MRHYETIYIIHPNLADEDYKAAITKFNERVEKQKGVVIKTEEWGKQRLAYLIKKVDKGSYVLMNYCGLPGLSQELERELKLDDRVLKYQTVKLADKVDPEALIMKEEEARKRTVGYQEKAVESEEKIQGEKEIAPNQEVANGV
ncbi:MAG: 30S ribosomal protein S6 [Pseudomonadota bacterium]